MSNISKRETDIISLQDLYLIGSILGKAKETMSESDIGTLEYEYFSKLDNIVHGYTDYKMSTIYNQDNNVDPIDDFNLVKENPVTKLL